MMKHERYAVWAVAFGVGERKVNAMLVWFEYYIRATKLSWEMMDEPERITRTAIDRVQQT